MQALWMVLAAFLFASMGVCVKIASAHFNAAELVCYRGLIGIVILWLLARSHGRWISFVRALITVPLVMRRITFTSAKRSGSSDSMRPLALLSRHKMPSMVLPDRPT